MKSTRNLFLAEEGPSLDYGDGTLYISDLNPQIETQWRMSRLELFTMGMRCVRASMSESLFLDRLLFAAMLIGFSSLVCWMLFFAHWTVSRGSSVGR